MSLTDVAFLLCFLSVFNDGTKRELFNLEGTIPVSYKGECNVFVRTGNFNLDHT